MKYKILNYEENRNRFDHQYQPEQWSAGLPKQEVSAAIRNLYQEGEAKAEPYAVTKAKMLDFLLSNIRISVNDFDSFAIVCERCDEMIKIAGERRTFFAEKALGTEEFQACNQDYMKGISLSRVDFSHTSPDWFEILELGVPGLLKRAEEGLAAKGGAFYEAETITFKAFRKFVLRFSDAARKENRPDLAEMTDFLADHAPENLQQALNLGLFYRVIQEMEGENVRSMGIFDRQYFPYYQHDLSCGLLTPESAEELLKVYFSHCYAESHGKDNGVPYCFGGLLPDGIHDGCNELTKLSLSAFRKLGKVDPKFSLRINDKTPKEILHFAAECIKEGKSAILFINEEIVRKAFLRNGKDPADLDRFIPIGCYEPAIMGKELCCSMTGEFNFLKMVELMMQEPDFSPRDFEDVMKKTEALLKEHLTRLMERINRQEKYWSIMNPATTISGTMTECMERGRDAADSGSKYTASGIMCEGIGSAVDALAAIRYLVFEQKKVTFDELRSILADDWKDHEELRLEAFYRAPKWGCGNDRADLIAKRIVDLTADMIEQQKNDKGGHFQMGLWSIDLCLWYGKRTGATPDGRHAGEIFSKNIGSTIGCDREGIAGLLTSAGKLDYTRFADGSVLDVMLPAKSVAGEAGTQFMIDVFQTWRKKGGAFMQYNILSTELLRAAQAEPERFQNLQIRLCGWNVRFIDLCRKMQDSIILEAESKES